MRNNELHQVNTTMKFENLKIKNNVSVIVGDMGEGEMAQ